MIGSKNYSFSFGAIAIFSYVIAMGAVAAAFSSAPLPATRAKISSSTEGSSTGLGGMPKTIPLDKCGTPTTEVPFFNYGLVNTDSKFKQVEITRYIEGAPIDELFELASDFTENSAFWGNLFSEFEKPSYKPGAPNGVGDVREFIWAVGEGKKGRHYVEQLSQCDPEAHTFVYTLHASRDANLFFKSLLTYCSFVDEPDKNRVKVTWHALIEVTLVGQLLYPFAIKKSQEKAYTSVIESMQDFFPTKK